MSSDRTLHAMRELLEYDSWSYKDYHVNHAESHRPYTTHGDPLDDENSFLYKTRFIKTPL